MATLRKRARAKLMTLPVAVTLAELRTPLEQSYRNTVYCGTKVTQSNGKVTQKYCGNRWCLLCSRVRTARAIASYTPVIRSWSDPHLATLTVPNVPAGQLAEYLTNILKSLESCRRSMKRTHGIALVAVRKLECTYNARRDDYHPHLHVVTETKEQAELLRTLWLDRHPECVAEAQDVRPCDPEKLTEVFKYFTKLTTPTTKKGGRGVAPAHSLDTIFTAMRGRRVYQPIGFKLDDVETTAIPDGPGTPSPSKRDPLELVEWEWSQRLADWVDYETGEVLSGYEPGDRFRAFVDGIADPDQCELPAKIDVEIPEDIKGSEAASNRRVAHRR